MEGTNNESVAISSDDSIKSISRIKEYPVIKDSFSKAGEYYNWIKSQSNTITSTLNWTESVIKDVVNKVEPLAGNRLKPLDRYTCSKLDTLENKYPIVKESSQEVIKSTSDYYESNIKPSVVYVASTPYRLTAQSIEALSNTANTFVSRYMTSSPSRDCQDGSDSVPSNQRYNLIFNEAIREIELIRRYTAENARNLSGLLSSIYNRTVANNEEWVRQYYEEFSTEVGVKATSSEIDTNSKLMHLAVSWSNRMRVSVRALSTVCYKHLSPENREQLDAVFARTEQLYGHMNRSTYDNLRERVTLENVHWIGETALAILGSARDAVLERYKENTGEDARLREDNEEVPSGDGCEHPVGDSES